MTLIVPWLLFPAVLGALALGAGLLVEEASGTRLRNGLRLPTGLALIIVAGLFTTATKSTAHLTVPLAVVLAVAGFLLATRRREKIRPSPARAILAAATYAAYAAPVVMTGQATFTGYVKLDDTASFLGFTDQIMSRGRDVAGLAPSTYQILLHLNIDEGYPVGTFVPLGIGSKLTGQDGLWLYQPLMAFYAAMAALALYALLGGLIRSTALRAFTAFVAANAALIYAYALWGGMKEIAATALIALTAALVPVRKKELRSARAQLPFAIAAAATLGVLSVSGLIWVGLLAIPALVILARNARRSWKAALAAVALLAALAIPSLAIASQFIHYTRSNLLTHDERYGNLIRALRLTQAFGIWPGGDFRIDPTHYTLTRILIAVAALAAIGAAVYAVRQRRIRLPLVAATVVVAAIFLDLDSSPWLTGKALATASPFLVALALLAGAILAQRGHPIPGGILIGVLSAAVLYSDVLGYRSAWVAPRGQLIELQQIGKLFAGQGPALMTEYQPYGVRHFLRKLDAEGASELRVRQVPLADGSVVSPGDYADIDRFRYPDLLTYRTLVLRRSPVESRPGAPYNLVLRGKWYDVWQRPATGTADRAPAHPARQRPGAVGRPRLRPRPHDRRGRRRARRGDRDRLHPEPDVRPARRRPASPRLDREPVRPDRRHPERLGDRARDGRRAGRRNVLDLDPGHGLAPHHPEDRRRPRRLGQHLGRPVRAARPGVPVGRQALRDALLRKPRARAGRDRPDLPARPARPRPRGPPGAGALPAPRRGAEPLRQARRLDRSRLPLTRD